MSKYSIIVPNVTGAAPQTFEELTNTPNDLTGHANKLLAVSTDESEIEFITPAGSYANLVYVALQGSDTTGTGDIGKPFRTLVHALSTITTAAPNNNFCIVLSPGVFVENNPIQMKDYVDIVSIAGQFPTVIAPANAAHLIQNSHLSNLSDLVISGHPSYSAFYANSPGISILKNIIIAGGDNLVHVNHVGASVNVINVSLAPSALATNGFYVQNGKCTGTTIFVVGDSPVQTAARVDGSNSILELAPFASRSNNVTNFIYATNGGHFIGSGITVDNCTNTVRLDSGGKASIIGLYSAGNNITYDLLQEDSNSQAELFSVVINEQKLSITNWDNIVIAYGNIDAEVDTAWKVSSEFHVGVPEKGRESCLGQGDSTSRGLLAYTWDNSLTTFTDVTSEAKSSSASTFTIGSDINDALYLSWDLTNGDYLKFYGFKVNVDTAAVLGTGDCVFEYYNGTSWTTMKVMGTDAEQPYLPYAYFKLTSTGDYQIRFNIYSMADWTKNDPTSSLTDRFWIRLRNTAAITSGASIEHIKLHTSRTETNEDGWIEYFGNARPTSSLFWDSHMISPGTDPAENNDIFLSKSLDVGKTGNKFGSTTTNRVALVKKIPYNIDTSCPIKMEVAFISTDTGGNANATIRWGYSKDDDSVYDRSGDAPTTAPNEQSIVDSIPITVAASVQQTQIFDIDISDLTARRASANGDWLWLSIERAGGSDTHPGDIILLNVELTYTTWCAGGHI